MVEGRLEEVLGVVWSSSTGMQRSGGVDGSFGGVIDGSEGEAYITRDRK